jgi:hypothetical protein
MASLLPEGKQQYFTAAGQPLVAGKLFTYQAGTSTPKNTFSNQAGTVPNTNPVILDSRGEALIFWAGSYRVELRDSLDNLIWTVDNVVESSQTDLITGSTGSLILPSGTIAQRDTTPSPGYLRFNAEISSLEMYYPTGWSPVQRGLVSGSTLKTVNGQSLLGAGNVEGTSTAVVVVTGTRVDAASGTNYLLTNPALVNRTNISIWSQDFQNDRVATRAKITIDASTAPDGTATGDKLVESTPANSGVHQLAQTVTSTLNTFTFSLYVRPDERTRMMLRAQTTPAFIGGEATFDLTAKTLVGTTGIGGGTITTNITNVPGTAWARYEINITATAGTSILTEIILDNGTGIVYVGDTVSGAYVWGSQLESGLIASNYSPTTTVPVSTSSGSEVVLPVAPVESNTVQITVANTRVDNVILRNGKTIMGLTEDMVINDQYATVALRFMNNSWRLV